MRRSVVAVIGALAMVVAIAATAVALTTDGDDNDAGHPMQGMMSGLSRGPTGWMRHGSPGWWMGHWMRGAWVGGEFEYLTEMVAHHEEAVAAAAEMERSSRPQTRAFGAAIVATQSAQIEQMKGWLDQWYPGRSTDVDYQPMMPDLSRLSGDRLDRAFLQGMIGHHMAAGMMSQQLLVRDLSDHDQVRQLAQSIRDDQHVEILQMRRWLTDWFGTRRAASFKG